VAALPSGWAGHGLASRRAPVRLSDLGLFAAAFVTNARGIAPVGQIDDLGLPVDPVLMRTLARVYGSAPWAACRPKREDVPPGGDQGDAPNTGGAAWQPSDGEGSPAREYGRV
jgi:hypothetical protein